MDYRGYNGTITIEDNTLVITHHGLIAKGGGLATGRPRSIPFAALSDVKITPATRLMNGHITLGVGGMQAASVGMQATGDANTVVFRYKDNEGFAGLYEFLQGVVETNRTSGVDSASIEVARPGKDADKYQQALETYDREDVAEAVSRMGWKFGGRRELKKLSEHLHTNERVRHIAQGTYGNDQGILVLTDQRLLFLFHGLTRQAKEDFPLRSISSVQTKAGFATGEVTLYASGNNATISQVVKEDLEPLANAIREGIANLATAAPQTPPAAAATADPVEALQRLKALHEAGLITEDEFTAKRQDILNRM